MMKEVATEVAIEVVSDIEIEAVETEMIVMIEMVLLGSFLGPKAQFGTTEAHWKEKPRSDD